MPVQSVKETGLIPFHTINVDEWQLIDAIVKRAFEWALQHTSLHPRDLSIDANVQLMRMDIAATHATRGLKLMGMLLSPAHEFIEDVVSITKNIDRKTGTIPVCVMLHAADANPQRQQIFTLN